jgi:hypothetical protein
MDALNSRSIFRVDVFLVLATIVGIIIFTVTLALGQQAQNSIMSNSKMPSWAANSTKNNTAIINIMNVSIVPDAAGLEDKAYQPNPVEIKAGQSVI